MDVTISQFQQGEKVVNSGSFASPRLDRYGAVVCNDAYGKYMEQVRNGNVFFASTQNTVVTFAAGLTTTTIVGIILSNPAGSTKLLVPLRVTFTPTTTVAGAVGLAFDKAYSAITHSTALTVYNAYLNGGKTGQGLCDSGTVLGEAPVVHSTIMSAVGTITNTAVVAQVMDLNGMLIMPASSALAITATAALQGICSIMWEEIDA
jgi:hypothetical protein